MASLAGIELEMRNIMDVQTDDLSEDEKLTIEAYMQELETLEAEKIDKFAGFILEEIGHAKNLREMSNHLLVRARAIENKIESLKSHYQFVMTQHDKSKIAGKTYTVSLRNSKSVSIASDSIELLPNEYKKVTVEPRKSEIKKALESGIKLDGCEIVESQSLQIR